VRSLILNEFRMKAAISSLKLNVVRILAIYEAGLLPATSLLHLITVQVPQFLFNICWVY